MTGHTDIVLSVDIRDEFVITGGKDNTCRLWKLSDEDEVIVGWKCLAVFEGHTMSVTGVSLARGKLGGQGVIPYFVSVG